MRKSTRFLSLIGGLSLLLAAMALHALTGNSADSTDRRMRAKLVHDLRLTDLCLSTEARYTRHPAMADLHAPFQDHPTALEHFPSGSLVLPSLNRTHASLP